MHVVFISNSTGKATAKVRAVLDTYAVRIGESAWATPITSEALGEVHKALKRGISRHTSVACYRNRGVNALDLLWVVGNRNRYDGYGRFAPETLSRKKEYPMPYRHAAILACVAGMSHDIGKSNSQFQYKIGNGEMPCEDDKESDGIRHEWVSAWIFDRMMRGTDILGAMAEWPIAMAQGDDFSPGSQAWMPVFGRITGATDAALALIATHHHAFGFGNIKGNENKRKIREKDIAKNNYHVRHRAKIQDDRLAKFDLGAESEAWSAHGRAVLKEAGRLQGIHDDNPDYWHGVALIARSALVLADHEVSALDMTEQSKKSRPALYANTVKIKNRKGKGEGKRVLNQGLLWHLNTVGLTAKRNIRMFANSDLPCLPEPIIEKIMAKSDPGSRFAWQDRAVDALPQGRGLVFNVASTGAGKTRANVKIACALRDGRQVRLSSAFNLRTLTLQTHDTYCDEIGMRKDFDCACMVGNAVIKELHENTRSSVSGDGENDGPDPFAADKEGDGDISSGISALEARGIDDLVVPEWLEKESARMQGSGARLKKMLAAPVLVSTIDYLNAAGDMTHPNADHAHALLRLAHSDLILDELDSYDVDSMVAVLRLIHISAMFGRNVIISSATLSPTLAGYARRAYLSGCKAHAAMFGDSHAPIVAVVSDLASPAVQRLSDEGFDAIYQGHLTQMVKADLAQTKVFRVVDAGDDVDAFCQSILNSAVRLHGDHGRMTEQGTRTSVGLVRLANTQTVFAVADRLIEDARVHVVTYHAREVLLRRAYKECCFDHILRRKDGDGPLAAAMGEHLSRLNGHPPKDAIFIMVATPVEEVGRDHDFDWAVIEPSSMGSIIQSAGRVNRHRQITINRAQANIAVLNRNYRSIREKSYKGKEGCVFVLPGNEIKMPDGRTSHDSHRMTDLLGVEIGAEKKLDVSLMFGGGRTRFAACDEDSIKHRLDTVVGTYLESNGHIAWLGKWFGDVYPLREKSAMTTWSALSDGGDVTFFQYDPKKSKDKKAKTPWVSQHIVNEPAAPTRAWLSPTIGEVIDKAKEWFGLSEDRIVEEKDMSFQVYQGQEARGVGWCGIDVERKPG